MLELRTGPGRRSAEVAATVVRELTAADLVLLEGERGIRPKPIERLRDRHHAMARLIAEGRKIGEVAAITGMTISRLSILQGDPTFAELVEFYRKDVSAAYAELHDHLAGISLDAVVTLRERLEDDPDELSTKDLLAIAQLGADRTGHGPQSSQVVNVNVNLASRLEAARKRVADRKLIDITPQEAAE